MATISLCLIVGNVESYIERCLTSFSPLADELCVVRAVGSLEPDKTLDIAREKFGARTAEYRNAPEHKDWPHVDDFSAARQQSFDMASGDYCFWVDSDDVLEGGADAVAAVRRLANDGGYPCFIFPYRIFGRGLMVPRERMVMPSAGQWRLPVHEHFDFHIKPARGIEDQRVVVCHLPEIGKRGGSERNLRILRSIPEAELSTGLLYHLHAELVGDKQIAESIRVAKLTLARKDLGDPERYEIFINLALVSEFDLRVRHGYLLQAYAADPKRREAIALLCTNAMDMGKNEDALAYGRQMMATPRPALESWNSRGESYGFIGDDIFSQALRVNNRFEQAEQIRRAQLAAAGGPSIALIHATRGRAIRASQARKTWLSLAEHPERIEHIFVYDSDDESSRVLGRMHSIQVEAGGGCVEAWNLGAFYVSAPVMIQMSDDWTPPIHWDRLILERIGDTSQPRVLAVSDGIRNDQLLCMAICTRAYWAQDWFLFHPWFTGVFSDNWFTEVAYRRGQVIDARDLVFHHDHPLASGQPLDETYQRQNAPERYRYGKAIFDLLRRGTDWSTVPGWFNYWPFYRRIATSMRDGAILAEIGTWYGRSLIFLAQELQRQGKRNCKLHAVDTFRGDPGVEEHLAEVAAKGGSIRADFERNLDRCGVRDMVDVIEGDSAESASQIANGALDFCYIDAAHDFESVKRDVAAWLPKVKSGGMIAGHDAQHDEVMRAVKEIIPQHQRNGVLWLYNIP